MRVLGIDTSNYTCSTAFYDTQTRQMEMAKHLLPTPEGSLGLRQSQAVFEHTKLLGKMMRQLFETADGLPEAIGVSARPRNVEGSYMPCFLTGKMAADSIGAVLGIPVYEFSHQQGHIAAALYSAKRLEWLHHSEFIAFHVSGGTTDCLLVKTGNGTIDQIEMVGTSLDLKAGQAIDRVGRSLGLPFPAGPHLEQLASQCTDKIKAHPTVKGLDCCLSGLENQCGKLKEQGAEPAYIARYCLQYIQQTLERMLLAAMERYGKKPVLFAGGVMSNQIIRDYFIGKYQACFAKPEFSSDNAGGIAVLAGKMEELA